MYLHRLSLFNFTSLQLKQPMTKITLRFFFLLLIFYTPLSVGRVPSSLGGQGSLKVSNTEFLASLKLVNETLQDTDNSRLPSAISTCLELLDLSTEEHTSWCVSALNSPQDFDRDLKWRTGVDIVPIQCNNSSNNFQITEQALQVATITEQALQQAYKDAQKCNLKVKRILITNLPNPCSFSFQFCRF